MFFTEPIDIFCDEYNNTIRHFIDFFDGLFFYSPAFWIKTIITFDFDLKLDTIFP